MARASGRLVMTGNKDGEFTMNVEFTDTMKPHPLRVAGYYVGKSTSAEMIEEITRRASTGMVESKPDVTGSVGNVTTASVDEVPTVESQSSTESRKPGTPGSSLMDTANEGDSPKGAGSPKAEDIPEKEINLEKDTTKEKDANKEEDSPEAEDSRIKGISLKGEDTAKEENTTKEEHANREEDFSKGEETTREEGFGEDVFAKEDSVKEEGSGKEVSRSSSVVALQPHLGPFTEKPARAMGRAPIGPLRRDLSSADQVETEVEEVDDYFVFAEDVDNPVSLCFLPLELEEGKTTGGLGSTTELFLRGKSNAADIMRPISAWKLIFLENASFQILVKIRQKSDAKWVKLGKPLSRFKETLEDVFLVAKVLALLKKEPQASEDRVWNHLLEGDVAPETFRDHLRMRYSLMEEFINLDPVLKETNVQKTLLAITDREKEANPGKRVLSDRDSSDEVENRPVKKFKTGNVVQKNEKLATRVVLSSYSMPEDENMGEYDRVEEYYDEDYADESDEEFGDSFCIFCDDGGVLLCCDGPCMRSFHATKTAGIQTRCTSLGFTDAAVASMEGKWFCQNCTYKQHQCYVCGKLGASTSDEALGVRQEVFVCNVACCGRFYHPKCIAKKLSVSPSARETLAENILAGKESFTCSLHTCKACGEGENREVEDLSLVKCRRCPTAWHNKCLPRAICFEEEAIKRKVDIRAWKLGEKKKQFICYCTDHIIIPDLGTPNRKHVKFALSPEAKEIQEAKETQDVERQKEKVGAVTKEPARYGAKMSPTAAAVGKNAGKKYPSAGLLAKPRPDRLPGSSSVPPTRPLISTDDLKSSEEAAQRTVASIMARSRRKVTEESVKSKHESSLPGIYKPKKSGTKEFMKMGMVDSILEAAKAAVEKIRHARNNEATTICDRKTVLSVLHEEERLRMYLAPTLFGKRYTSYGRHFTKVQKLEKVVEILQPYIWEKDTIVDFSCGDNSFCRLLREALSRVGKTNCMFKNFDLFPSKDAFGFEQKDWLQVGLKDCGPGESLVIGLNPPFAFVEKFVSHALGMNPRLLVLIVPPMKKNLEHLGYECLVDDDSLMAEKSFYLPGSVNERSTECLEQGNNVAPHFFIYCRKKFSGRYKVGVPELPEGPSRANPSAMIRKSEKLAKPPPPSEPTASLFIPSAPQRPPPGQAPNPRAPGKVATSRKRDPRLPLQVPTRVSRPVDAGAQEEGELPNPQVHVPFRNNTRPTWRHEEQFPPLFPPHPHLRTMHPRHHSGPYPPAPFSPYHQRPEEYSPFEPGLFPPSNYMGLPPVHPQLNGFHRGPRREEYLPGPPPSRHHEFPPEDDDGSFGGWIDR